MEVLEDERSQRIKRFFRYRIFRGAVLELEGFATFEADIAAVVSAIPQFMLMRSA